MDAKKACLIGLSCGGLLLLLYAVWFGALPHGQSPRPESSPRPAVNEVGVQSSPTNGGGSSSALSPSGSGASIAPSPDSSGSHANNSTSSGSLDRRVPDGSADSKVDAVSVASSVPGRTTVPGSVDPSDPAIAGQVTGLLDNDIPLEQRREQIASLVKQADTAAARVLMAVGQTDAYLNDSAVDALGHFRSADVADYLRGRLVDSNPRVVVAAARSLVQVTGAAAVPDITKTLSGNRVRPDGFQDMVCAACVQALGETKSKDAIPMLAAELKETAGNRLGYDYGSQVVKALSKIGDASAVPTLEGYRKRLEEVVQRAPENPMGKRYMESRIHEVDEAIAAFRR